MRFTKYNIGLLQEGDTTSALVMACKKKASFLQDYFVLHSTELKKITWPKKHRAIVGLPEEQVIIKTLTLDKQCSDLEIYQYLKRNGEKLFHMPVENLCLDYAVLGPHDDLTQHVIALACKKSAIAALVQQCKTLGLNLQVVDYQPFAWIRALSLCNVKPAPCYALLYLGQKQHLCVTKTQNQILVQKENGENANNIKDTLLRLGIEQRWCLGEDLEQTDLNSGALYPHIDENAIKNLTSHSLEKPTLSLFTCLGLSAWSKRSWP